MEALAVGSILGGIWEAFERLIGGGREFMRGLWGRPGALFGGRLMGVSRHQMAPKRPPSDPKKAPRKPNKRHDIAAVY